MLSVSLLMGWSGHRGNYFILHPDFTTTLLFPKSEVHCGQQCGGEVSTREVRRGSGKRMGRRIQKD